MSDAATNVPQAQSPIRAVIGQSIEFSPSRKALMLARLKAQAACMEGATKNKLNPFAKSNYATLESVLLAVADPLTSNGLVLTQWVGELARGEGKADATMLYVYTRIEHAESSEYMQVCMMMPLTKSDPQGIGIAMTYGRRYSLKAALGIPEIDDDGQGQTTTPSGEPQPKRKSSAEGKRDGTTELFNEIREEIRGAINVEMLSHIGRERADEVKTMPDRWAQEIRDEYETKLDELKAK